MQIFLHLEYFAQWGDQLFICFGEKPEKERPMPSEAIPLNNDGRGHWFARVDGNLFVGKPYHYILCRDNVVVRCEWGDGHFLPSSAYMGTPATLQVFDAWIINPIDLPFFSSAFTQSIFDHTHITQEGALSIGQPNTLTLQCEAATIRKGQVLAVCGDIPEFGNWDPSQAAVMDAAQQPVWSLTIDRDDLNFPIQYKFVILDEKTHELIEWENNCNRYFEPGTLHEGDAIILRNLRFNNPQNPWRGAGTAIPVFSLRSKESCGIGEFNDLRLLVDWAEMTKQRIIQILPINDTTIHRTWRDSYPYNCNSTFALNPIYINLESVGKLKDETKYKSYRRRRQQLNRLPAVDYEKVTALKWEYLQLIYAQQGEEDLNSQEYLDFYTHNNHWLDAYAIFCMLRDKYGTACFDTWKEAKYTPEILQKFTSGNSKTQREIGLHKFIQFHLHRQLQSVRDYAHQHGVVLKGDIPIGISRYSVDAWSHPHLFHLDGQAGAPPDAFDKNGQNWGFPTYNWEAMAKENYRWFKNRFVKMNDYFDAYRIDHVLGFFRIWEVPVHAVQGLLGHFNPALPLSPEQMRREYGFVFETERHTLPYITDESLATIFGGNTDDIQRVKTRFFDLPLLSKKTTSRPKEVWKAEAYGSTPNKEERVAATRYRFMPRFATQRSVEAFFAKSHAEDAHLKDGLFKLLTEVLFVEDPRRKGFYHPRINGMDTLSFHALTPEQQHAYCHLHEDFFYHKHNEFWRHEGMKKLPILTHATKMLACGEDLGMIPACVPEVMEELRILSLEIQRMPKAFAEFGNPNDYPYYSVCTTSSHDLSNLRAWWTENPEATARYYTYILQGVGQVPATAEAWLCSKIIEQHMASPSIFAILPLQDWLSIDAEIRYPIPEDERVNVPSNPDNYWQYRMHITLEELLKAENLNQHIVSIIKKYDR